MIIYLLTDNYFKFEAYMENQSPWKARVQEILNVCQDELKRTTQIGKKMISASKTNTSLHESYEELGQLLVKALEKGEIEWDNLRVQSLIKKVKECEKNLDSIESELNKIKFSESVSDEDKTE